MPPFLVPDFSVDQGSFAGILRQNTDPMDFEAQEELAKRTLDSIPKLADENQTHRINPTRMDTTVNLFAGIEGGDVSSENDLGVPSFADFGGLMRQNTDPMDFEVQEDLTNNLSEIPKLGERKVSNSKIRVPSKKKKHHSAPDCRVKKPQSEKVPPPGLRRAGPPLRIGSYNEHSPHPRLSSGTK